MPAGLVLLASLMSCGGDDPIPIEDVPRSAWRLEDLSTYALDDWRAFLELGVRADSSVQARRVLDEVYDDAGALASSGSRTAYDALLHGVEALDPAAIYHYGLVILLGSPDLGLEPRPALAEGLFMRAYGRGSEGAGVELCRGHVEGWSGYYPTLGGVPGLEFCERLTHEGVIDAVLLMGDLYRDGRRHPRDIERAVEYYRMAAKYDSAEAYVKLGVLAAEGRPGVPADHRTALQFYVGAVERGHIGSVAPAVRILERTDPGSDPEADSVIAFKLWELVERRGDAAGAWGLARAFACGFGVSPSPVERDYWAQRAALMETVIPGVQEAYESGCGPL